MEQTIEKNTAKVTDSTETENENMSPVKNRGDPPSWSKIKDRYINLWRGKLNKEGYKEGIRDTLLLGSLSSILFMLAVPQISLIGSLMFFYMGTILGSGINGYLNKLDMFGGIHIGLVSSFGLIIPMIIWGILSSPVATLFMIPMMIIYIVSISISHGIYAVLWNDEEQDALESETNPLVN